MHEVHEFGLIVLLISTGFALAVISSRVSERLRIPGPALFLIAAALLSDAFPSLAIFRSARSSGSASSPSS